MRISKSTSRWRKSNFLKFISAQVRFRDGRPFLASIISSIASTSALKIPPKCSGNNPGVVEFRWSTKRRTSRVSGQKKSFPRFLIWKKKYADHEWQEQLSSTTVNATTKSAHKNRISRNVF
eukprot:636411_1